MNPSIASDSLGEPTYYNEPVNATMDLLKQLCASDELQLISNWTELMWKLRISRNASYHQSDLTEEPVYSFDKPTATKVWGIGLLFVTIISSCAAIGIALMPLLSRRTYRRLLVYLIGLGVGSLSGSAVFHLLPQAWQLLDPDGKNHEYLGPACMTIAGIYLFFLVDKLLKIVMEWRKRRKAKMYQYRQQLNAVLDCCIETPVTDMPTANHVLADGQSHGDGVHGYSIPLEPTGRVEVTAVPNASSVDPNSMDSLAKVGNTTVDVLKEIQRMCSHDHEVHFEKGQSVISTVAWMIIFGDGLHNFIDGLSIGAAFTDSILSGISVSVAVFCEEFPHELGDVAILVSAGMTLRQALLYNLLSAATCYFGFVLGVIVGELTAATTYIFALAGGMFLYISLGSMAPEMNGMLEKSLRVSIRQGLLILLLQSLGVLTGLLLMYVMSRHGPDIQFN